MDSKARRSGELAGIRVCWRKLQNINNWYDASGRKQLGADAATAAVTGNT